MKKKTLLSEVRQLQKIAGILKENRVQDVLDNIVDTATSGQGQATGLTIPKFQDQIKKLVASLSPEEKQELSTRLNHMVETTEGWTDLDVDFLNSLGLNITAKPSSDDPVMDQIEKWYWKSNPRADYMSQEEIESGLAAHYDEWMKSKQFYDGNIRAYFDEVERNGDWY